VLGERWPQRRRVAAGARPDRRLSQIAYNWTTFIPRDGETRPMAISSAIQVASFWLITAR